MWTLDGGAGYAGRREGEGVGREGRRPAVGDAGRAGGPTCGSIIKCYSYLRSENLQLRHRPASSGINLYIVPEPPLNFFSPPILTTFAPTFLGRRPYTVLEVHFSLFKHLEKNSK